MPDNTTPTAQLVTDTGAHPAIVIKPEAQGRFVAGLALDIVAVICITVLIALDKVTALEGLPFVALVLSVKIRNRVKNGGGGASGGGAILSLIGM